MTDSLRALKFLFIAMGAVIVIGTGVVIITIIQRASAKLSDEDPAPQASQASVPEITAPTGFGSRTLEVPRGSRIVNMVAEGNRLIVRLDVAGGGRQILILDTMTGARLGTFEVREAP